MIQCIDNIEEGILPESLDELTSTGKIIMKVNAKSAQTMAVIIAAGRDHLQDIRKWSIWCIEEFGIENVCYRSHLMKIGEMLNALLKKDVAYYKILFQQSSDKLLAITRLPIDAIPAFIEDNQPLAPKSREEIRELVSLHLGEEVRKSQAKQGALPGFDEAVEALASMDGSRFRTIIADEEKAEQSMYASLGLLGASMEYYKMTKSCSTESLITVKHALLEEISTIDQMLSAE